MTEQKDFKMFDRCTNKELRRLILEMPNKWPRIYHTEISEQERKGHVSIGSQMRFLNRYDLLFILYGYIMPEISLIDNTPLDNLPFLINESWACPQLLERIKWRLSNAK